MQWDAQGSGTGIPSDIAQSLSKRIFGGKQKMARQDGGWNFPIADDNQVLDIDSPRRHIEGPHVVVDRSLEERWVVVALNWIDDDGDRAPCLGIRWFHGTAGYPMSRGYSTWFIFPQSSGEFNLRVVEDLLSIPNAFAEQVKLFLAGKITGEELREFTVATPR